MDTEHTHGTPGSTPARQAFEGEEWTDLNPEIQNAGVDTIEFSFDVEVSQAMWDHPEEERQIAQFLHKRQVTHVPDWLNAVVHPTGARGGYRFLLETSTFSIKLLKGVPHRPPIYVEIRAFGLHTHNSGARGACDEACAFIREFLLGDQDPSWTARAINLDTARCSRLDLFLDWQGGWHPDFEHSNEHHFVKRVHADVTRRSTTSTCPIGSWMMRRSESVWRARLRGAVEGQLPNSNCQPLPTKGLSWAVTLPNLGPIEGRWAA
jgi:hypothetical protein